MSDILVRSINSNYKIYIKDNLDTLCNLVKEKYGKNKIFLVTEDIVYNLYKNTIINLQEKINCSVFYFNHGEQNKSIDTVLKIYDFLLKNDANRDSILIGLGGGLVGDIVGFAASTYMRGIKFVNVPTTMLSQIDSCIGGKVGYNYDGIKNLIGNFFNPDLVYVCPHFLKTLEDHQFKDGLGELVKYGVIDSQEFFDYIDGNYSKILHKDTQCLLHIIEKCLDIKKNVVEKDFRDTGLRNILNFGHTIGHAVEISSKFSISHGEAVGLGTLAALKISEHKFNISEDVYKSVEYLLKRLGLSTRYKIEDYCKFLDTIKHDKKNDENIRFVLIEKSMGDYKIKVEVTEAEIKKALGQSIDS
ncbi:3-dehydroquinate synthase [Clostridium tyrobutyricum]|uniref:3-dehydroquinate synthase n=1 Tax=Clostridium tyrobutyricum TaxID=1519 RepID=UPI001C394949|nr:3-dehydroquinate synthase [Clostridium tyrobutyricum]MBR9646893.1 3-dehydroquinate synthase [Clostridium tyrobutyricum]MBV4426897.1 3-dehydroquinate synthase [Clostridium tyrobutyricum]MBV4442053.1 3-dehydroquinate synthase [Clostridium tyrobutyricum]